MDFSLMTIKEINAGLRNKDFSVVDLNSFFINQIEEKNKEINAYISFSKEAVLKESEIIDNQTEKNKFDCLLAGIPYAAKDNILVENSKCTAGSIMLENYIAPYSATVINKLKEKKAVLLGKTNMDEFAMGSSTETSFFNATKNPLDVSRVPGGSSGGSAAAVASNQCVFALGTDTGGSVRQPASFCGVIGMKPTYGSISRNGVVAMASSLDQVGIFTKKIDDLEEVFKSISGKDENDSTSVEYEFSKKEIDFSKISIGVPKEYFSDGLDSEVRKVLEQAINQISDSGIKIKEITVPNTEYALPAYYLIMASEVSANMARFDGLRFGFSSKDSKDLIDSYFENRGKGLGMEVKRRIILGTYSLSAGYKDAYYEKAIKARTLIRNNFKEILNEVDLIFCPTSPTLPFKINEKLNDPLSMYLSDVFTVTANLTGLPALSMPCGKTGNLSVGMQIIGGEFKENKIIEAAKIFEKIWKQ